MRIKNTAIIIFFISAPFIGLKAQEWKIKSYNLGYRIFEINAVGNNPTTIASLLKEPAAYQRYLSSITSNTLYGNPQILQLHTFYVNTEWQKDRALLRFWKKYTVHTGLLLTTRIKQDAGAIGDENYFSSSDTVMNRNLYSLTKNQQFFGANAGVNRRFVISKKLNFMTGLHAQGSFALVHNYKQRWDSSTYTQSGGWNTKTTQLHNLKGKNFFQWQLMVPLGLEYEFLKKQFFIRFELDAGIVGSRYRPKNFSAKEAHGAGLWLVYKPTTNR
jgi:hypothetical protein